MTVGSVSAGFLPFLSVTVPLETRVGSDWLWDPGAFPLTRVSECARARGCLSERARACVTATKWHCPSPQTFPRKRPKFCHERLKSSLPPLVWV